MHSINTPSNQEVSCMREPFNDGNGKSPVQAAVFERLAADVRGFRLPRWCKQNV